MTQKQRRGRPAGETLGGIIVGFDQQIMRTLPPPHELVLKGAPIRGLNSEDGGLIDVALLNPTVPADPAAPTVPADPPTPTVPADPPTPTDPGDLSGASMASTSDLMDERADELDVCESQMRQYGAITRFAGRVRTVRCHEDNVLLREMLAGPGSGDVLVVDGSGSFRTALMGDMIAGLAVAHGWAGIVINGCIRDVEALGRLPIGIKALGSNPRRSAKTGAGESDVPVTFGGVTFHPGARLTSDEDGIVVTRTGPS